MLAIVLGLITVVLTSFAVSVIGHAINFNIQGFSIFFIFPIGAALVGWLGASGLAIGQKISKKPIKTSLIAISALFGLLALFGSYYVDYANLKNQLDGRLDKSLLTKTELNKYEEETSFMSYMKVIHEKSTSTISLRGSKKIDINNQWVSRISFWISALGSVMGGVFLAFMVIGIRTKDEKTGEYRQLKFEGVYDFEVYDKLVESLEVGDFSDISKIITQHTKDKDLAKTAHSKFYVLYSPKTGEGQAIIQRLSLVNNNLSPESSAHYEVPETEMVKILEVIRSVQPKEKF